MKITKTYSIEESVFNAFDRMSKRKNINKSSFIEDAIQAYLEECGIDYVDKLYCSKLNKDFIVQILDQDDTYYNLSDGSKIQRILFMQLFEEVRGVDPEVFMNQSEKVFEEIANVIKKIDTEKLEPFPVSIKNVKVIDNINITL